MCWNMVFALVEMLPTPESECRPKRMIITVGLWMCVTIHLRPSVCVCLCALQWYERKQFLQANEQNGNESFQWTKQEPVWVREHDGRETGLNECGMIEVFGIIFTGRGTFIHCIIWFRYAHMAMAVVVLAERMSGAHRDRAWHEEQAMVLRYHRQTTNQPDGNHTSNAMAHENECRPEKWNSLHRTQIINGFAFCMCPKCYVERVSD